MDQEQMQGKAEQSAGMVKEKVGQAVNNPELVAEGQNDQDEGKLHEALGVVRDKVRDGAGVVMEKAEELGERIRDAAQRVTHHDDAPKPEKPA